VERRLKERLTGAAVLVMIAVIFIPMILDNSNGTNSKINQTNIPPKPETNYRSRIIPVDETPNLTPSTQTDVTPPPVQAESMSDDDVTESPASPQIQAQTPAPQESTAVIDTPPDSASGAIGSRGLTAWVVQLGSFSNQDNAQGLIRRLQSGGYPAYIEELAGDSGTIFRVRVGPELSRSDAELTLKELDQKFALKGILLQYP
jgi:DedD protein